MPSCWIGRCLLNWSIYEGLFAGFWFWLQFWKYTCIYTETTGGKNEYLMREGSTFVGMSEMSSLSMQISHGLCIEYCRCHMFQYFQCLLHSDWLDQCTPNCNHQTTTPSIYCSYRNLQSPVFPVITVLVQVSKYCLANSFVDWFDTQLNFYGI